MRLGIRFVRHTWDVTKPAKLRPKQYYAYYTHKHRCCYCCCFCSVFLIPRVDRFINNLSPPCPIFNGSQQTVSWQPSHFSWCYHANAPSVFLFASDLVLYLVLFLSPYNFLLSLKHKSFLFFIACSRLGFVAAFCNTQSFVFLSGVVVVVHWWKLSMRHACCMVNTPHGANDVRLS